MGYEPDFIERNGAWLLSVLGVIGTCTGYVLVYFLKSRCSYIRFCGVECHRDTLDMGSSNNQATPISMTTHSITSDPSRV